MSIDDFRNLFRNTLSGISEPEEIENLCFIALEYVLNKTRVEISLSRKCELSTKEEQALKEVLNRLEQSEPIQYIIGSTEFYGLKFLVNPATLIPRPETEELVAWVLESIRENVKSKTNILDIGTGSGCIAIAIAAHDKTANVSAVDISKDALMTARENALTNNVEVDFTHKDILKATKLDRVYDIFVSNPPYIRALEKAEMRDNVLLNEPDSALFVPDDDPLIFYRKIAQLAYKNLAKDGILFFEINEYLGAEMLYLLKEIGFNNLVLKKDIFGKERMIKAKR
ncbi:peptide chain release factor N(5)-glutamine methyltransferase [Dokdonia sp. Hel_I_53]|uniref:peptide chain release factor N(5)-glutamine methyltransferase n=1 Tax=Dokdonia sp. Hel_I_53 TaxID=1566287 RepID=UPI00119C73A1|nr:peptide chain release factor N(5)-glutamine methyltransferase [Dokdonia sp. Hel_I_53]TVZ53256.1 release factor glutamine methyltransferase [Dokdonia sp. Hel_I_53]